MKYYLIEFIDKSGNTYKALADESTTISDIMFLGSLCYEDENFNAVDYRILEVK